MPGDRFGRHSQEPALAGRESEPVEVEDRPRKTFADPRGGMTQLLGREDVAVGVAVAREPLRELLDLLLDRRGLDRRQERRPRRGRASSPASARRRARRRPLDLGGRPPDPIGHAYAQRLGFFRRREGRQRDAREPLARALRVGVEDADRRDAVAVELDAHRELPVRREDVEEPAAHGEVARLDDEIAAPVPDGRQAGEKAWERDLLPA